MKFAKELEKEAVPEWRIKYLNYKSGKKHIKAVSRAIGRANTTPGSAAARRTPSFFPPHTPRHAPSNSKATVRDVPKDDGNGMSIAPGTASTATTARPPASKSREHEALAQSGHKMSYGSFLPSPDEQSLNTAKKNGSSAKDRDSTEGRPTFELPAPAMHVDSNSPDTHHEHGARSLRRTLSRLTPRRSISLNEMPRSTENTPPMGVAKRMTASTTIESPSQLRRFFTHASGIRNDRRGDFGGAFDFDIVREKEHEFFEFLDSELDKVESFYKMKEEQAGQRLNILRVQLHEMRNRRIQEMTEDSYREEDASRDGPRENGNGTSNGKLNGWVEPIKAKIFAPGPNSKALQKMSQTPGLNAMNGGDAERDYIRRPQHHEVPYRTAKRKLKLALQEFYRGLELLKSYALLNRTAFRKLNKKYDKAVNARPPYRYLNEKVNQAWFVNSDVLEGHIRAVEDLYARYFERGNHKLAAGKLRSLTKKADDLSGSTFSNGMLIGTGAVFAIQGLIYGAQLLWHEDATIRIQTSYLMQIYGGYFLMLYLTALFCIDCSIWNQNKVNYPFIFEFDQRHHLDWRQLAQFPSFFFLVLGLFMWVNFSRYGTPAMYIYYPVVLIFVTVFILFFPAPLIWYKSRRWFLYSHWRLLLAGIYPVEFRDFFLGDIYCSLTYATANVELFFCLYANRWENPVQCNSSHSRVLGFMTALPPIWRFLQCLRRYKDTRNIFPHLVNGGKYMATIVAAITLSLFRIHNSTSHLALFITFSTVNSIYCSIWDLFMDFSLIQPGSRHRYLRDILALKGHWPYYFIMGIDPVLRFAWVFYAIFTHNTQHSTIVSFMVSFMEVTRRGMWALFRVENEHCANVAQYKASRDVPLPYRIEPLIDQASSDALPGTQDTEITGIQGGRRNTASTTGIDTVEEGGASHRRVALPGGGVRRNFSKILAEAHKQDFEKKRRPEAEVPEEISPGDQSDDDDGDDEQSLMDVQEVEQLRRNAGRGENE